MGTSYGKTHSEVTDPSRSALRRYQRVIVGSTSVWYTLQYEALTSLLRNLPGALGLLLRAKFYPGLFKGVGRGVVFGQNISLLHPNRITLGNNVIIADDVILDARGDAGDGITIGDNTVVGRGASLNCKNGSIQIGHDVQLSDGVNVGASSGNRVEIGNYALIAAHTYIGGIRYHTERTDVPIQLQGTDPRGGVQIGPNAWIGVRTIVLDGNTVGQDAVVGAGAVVTTDIPPFAVAVGVPARVMRMRTATDAGIPPAAATGHDD